jgi:hypothetical protein
MVAHPPGPTNRLFGTRSGKMILFSAALVDYLVGRGYGVEMESAILDGVLAAASEAVGTVGNDLANW